MELANDDNFAWVHAYFRRLLLEPDRHGQALVAQDRLAAASTALQDAADATALNAWLDEYASQDAQLRCRNALYQRKCSQGLQRLSLKKALYGDLMALAADKGYTLNQAVEYLLDLHRNGGRSDAPPSADDALVTNSRSGDGKIAESPLSDVDEEYRERMILWAMSRSTGYKDDD
ncbi:hypothetical protein [Methylogaea oryzae]|uniref:Uncharacterized protein n=1 Tax=Methylogaea oryzae TaxID=1295382 RepID=A0A8D5AK70_9GAMM|nr:hypothetical protein [Methylogaea oryzae]BBL70801.1 hypothetical protein MoryE10_14070 [Methylogaea oryzae]